MVQTDDHGHFIVYSPRGPIRSGKRHDINDNIVEFYAAPEYPFTAVARDFAHVNQDIRKCQVRVIAEADDRRFCNLTCSRLSKYDQKQFEKFVAEQLADPKAIRDRGFRPRPREREGSTERGVRNEYEVKVVSPTGDAIPNALIHFTAYDGYQGNSQIQETDENGKCTLVEELLAKQGQKYRDGLRRWLTADIPGFAVGPVTLDLRKDAPNVIVAKPVATVAGRVLDWHGNAFPTRVTVRYKNRNHCSFEFDARGDAEGQFTIGRIMPEEPFRLLIHRETHQSTPSAEVWSGTMTLTPGEQRKDIVLKVPQSAALRGIVVDEENRPVKDIWSVMFHNREGGWGHGEPNDGRIGAFAVAPIPTQIKVNAKGFEPYVSEEIPLEPGELHFVRVVMKREKPKNNPSPRR